MLIGLLVVVSIVGAAGSGILFLNNQNLNSQLQETTDEYEELDNSHNDLLDQYTELNQTYTDLILEYESLNTTYYILTGEHYSLNSTYYELINQHDILNQSYSTLSGEYQSLNNSYYDLQDDYQLLSDSYTLLTTWMKQQILPVQYCLFAEAVRRYYAPLYLSGESEKEQFMGAAEFARDIVLHDSLQYNAFVDVSNALSDALIEPSDNMAYSILYDIFDSWLPNWGTSLVGDELAGIDAVHQWCVDNIDYEYDSDITLFQEESVYDYSKFPVETAFRTLGDCEDQAILEAAYLESCGFETAIAVFHDPNHPTIGEFYHATLLVHIVDTDAFGSMYPGAWLWDLGYVDPYEGYTWVWLDPTWDVSFGDTPGWLQGYIDAVVDLSWDIMSVAICDVGGAVG